MSRLYLPVAASWKWGLKAADAAFVGFWLGVLDRDALHAVDDAVYGDRTNYHSEEHNQRGLFPWEEEAIREHFADARRLLLLAAGGGREAIALARMGHAILGFECNAALVEAGRRHIARLSLSDCASIDPLARDLLPELADRVDGAIVGWSGYMLIPGRERRIQLLRGLRGRIADGGPLLISFFSRSADTGRLRAIARTANLIRRVMRRPPVELGDDLAPNFVHRFTLAEVERELAEAGFRTVAVAPEGSGPYQSGYAVGRATLPSSSNPARLS